MLVEQAVKTGIVGQVQALLHLAALYLDDWLPGPVMIEEHKARQNLCGAIPLVGTLAIELLGEVQGIGLHGADTVVVDHKEPTKAVCRLLGQHAGRSAGCCCVCCHAIAAYKAGGCTAQQLTVASFRVNEYPDERHKQQGIAGIGDGDAPRVAVHGQGAALQVVVITALVEAHTTVRDNVVHGYHPLLTTVDDDVRAIVGRSLRTLVILHFEAL